MTPGLYLLIAVALLAGLALVRHARRHGSAATLDLLVNPDHQRFGDPLPDSTIDRIKRQEQK